MTTKAVIAMASLALMFGLGALWLVGAFAFLPSERAVARAFTESHPELRVARVIPGRGDEDGFNFKIHYHAPGASEIRTAEWRVYTSGVHWGWKLDSEELDVSIHGPLR